MWDERYSAEEYAFGTQPNDFLVEMADHLRPGRVLCIGEGEGRNGVWLAQRGFEVTGVDASAVGLEKARRLAKERSVNITTVQADLADYPIAPESCDNIVSIFCHVPEPVRRILHRRVIEGLKPGGVFLLEAYTPKQLAHGTGGPPSADMMPDLAVLRRELAGLELLYARELERDVVEGRYHTGLGAVVQLLAMKPLEN